MLWLVVCDAAAMLLLPQNSKYLLCGRCSVETQHFYRCICFSRVRAVRLNTSLCQVSLPSPPNRTCQFPSIRLSSLPFGDWPSIVSNTFGSCTLCSSCAPHNWKTCRSCRVRGRVLDTQEHQPLPAEPRRAPFRCVRLSKSPYCSAFSLAGMLNLPV